MILFILISGSIYLIKSYFSSLIHSKPFIGKTNFEITKNTRFIYNKKGQKLYADFIFGEKSNYISVLYLGYGADSDLVKLLKKYYLHIGFSVVIICADGFGISGKCKRVDDDILTAELSDWLEVIKDTFGNNAKIFLHGFSYTALSVLHCSGKCYVVFADNTHLFPTYNYKVIKNNFIKKLYKNKSRGVIHGINIPVFLSAENSLSKEACKLYEISSSVKEIYIYHTLDLNEYIKRIDTFIRQLIQPEE